MTTLEHIQQEIKTLPTAEQFSLWRDLGRELNAFSSEDEGEIDREWDAEIKRRLDDFDSGKVTMTSLEEVDAEMNALFASHGLDRQRSFAQGL
jgi:putative addiction module component (TIGR02574 family)